MPDNKHAPWDARSRRLPASPPVEVRRALDPETGKPFGKLTILEKLKLKTMNALIHPFITGWLPRQLLKLLSGVAVTIGATADSAEQTALFVTAGVAWVAEIGLSWVSNKWARRNALKNSAGASSTSTPLKNSAGASSTP